MGTTEQGGEKSGLSNAANTQGAALPSWFYASAGEPHGPYSLDQMREFLRSGEITLQTLVCKMGMQKWHRAGQFCEFADLMPPPIHTTPSPIEHHATTRTIVAQAPGRDPHRTGMSALLGISIPLSIFVFFNLMAGTQGRNFGMGTDGTMADAIARSVFAVAFFGGGAYLIGFFGAILINRISGLSKPD